MVKDHLIIGWDGLIAYKIIEERWEGKSNFFSLKGVITQS
jgi:hypothetical protein